MSTSPAHSPRFPTPIDRDTGAIPRRRESDAETARAEAPAEQRSLVKRLAEEIATLRRALDASQHRIAALEVEAAEEPISGLLNRRAFIREIERAIAFQTRYPVSCGIALIDVEGLDRVRAAGGQGGLNRALRNIGQTLRAGIRSCDVAARTGNEQFAVVLWNSAATDCGHRVNGLQRAIAGLQFEAGSFIVTTQSAVAMIENGMTAEAIIGAAEALLPSGDDA
jgi:diguanylate cyclase (GGDEF)-like protein